MAAHSLIETARDALFLARLPPTRLAWVYLAIAVVSLVLFVLQEQSRVRSGRTALDHALHDGEDHELLATLSTRRAERLATMRWSENVAPCVIGRVQAGSGLRVPTDENGTSTAPWRREGGWLHGER